MFLVSARNMQGLAGQHVEEVLSGLSPNVRKRVDFLREIQVLYFSCSYFACTTVFRLYGFD